MRTFAPTQSDAVQRFRDAIPHFPTPATDRHEQQGQQMKTVEVTTRVRVPDETTAEQLRELSVAAGQAVADYTLDAPGFGGRCTVVTPLQDVIVYNDPHAVPS